MAAVPIRHTPSGLTESPDSGRVEVTYQSFKVTKIFEGAYADCISDAPPVASTVTLTGFSGTPIVTSCCIEPMHGGQARLIYVAEVRNANYVYEVDWTQVQRPLELNSRYTSGGARALTDSDLIDLHFWKAEPDPTTQKAFQYSDGSTAVPLSTNATDFARKYLKGEEGYFVFTPVARRIRTDFLILTVGSNLGSYTASPPFSGAPTGYLWLKVTDRAHYENGFWTRTEEWQGFDALDQDLYG